MMYNDIHPPLEKDPNADLPTELTDLQQTAFYRIIMSVHDFVMFLQDLYIPYDAIQMPPVGGWPQVTKETWSSFGKSDEVIEVVRHMTYIKRTCTYDAYEFLPNTGLEDYRDRYHLEKIANGNGRQLAFMTEMPEEPEPAHVLGIAVGGPGSMCILLDCRNGVICKQGDMNNGFAWWDDTQQQPVERFFATLKEQFRQMKLLPRSDHQVSKESSEFEGVFKPLKKIYEKHGWPDNYQRDKCVAEVTEFGEPGNLLWLAGYGEKP